MLLPACAAGPVVRAVAGCVVVSVPTVVRSVRIVRTVVWVAAVVSTVIVRIGRVTVALIVAVAAGIVVSTVTVGVV